MDAKGIAGTAVGLGSVALMGHAAGMATNSFKKQSHRKRTKRMVRGGVGLIVGAGMLGAAASAQQAM